MTKTQLVAALAEEMGSDKKAAAGALDAICGLITKAKPLVINVVAKRTHILFFFGCFLFLPLLIRSLPLGALLVASLGIFGILPVALCGFGLELFGLGRCGGFLFGCLRLFFFLVLVLVLILALALILVLLRHDEIRLVLFTLAREDGGSLEC